MEASGTKLTGYQSKTVTARSASFRKDYVDSLQHVSELLWSISVKIQSIKEETWKDLKLWVVEMTPKKQYLMCSSKKCHP